MRRVAEVMTMVTMVTMVVAATAHAGERKLYTNTQAVEDLVVRGDRLFVATRGGLEQYDLGRQQRTGLTTTEEGLPSNFVRRVWTEGGEVWVALEGSVCQVGTLDAIGRRRAACRSVAPETRGAVSDAAAPRQYRGARITAETVWRGQRVVGTATAGVWLGETDLSPLQTVCSNHIVAMARFAGRMWFGSFDEGLCSLDGAGWQRAHGGFRMINDLVVAGDTLYVASSEGLFTSRDGEQFRKITAIPEAVADLAYDPRQKRVLAVTNTTLWRVPLSGRKPTAQFRPGGARSLQAVAVGGDAIWLASEDRGAIRLRGKQTTLFDALSGLPTSWTLDIGVGTDGKAYVGTLRHGVFALDATTTQATPLAATARAWTLAMVPTATGEIYIGTQAGLLRYDGGAPGATITRPVETLPHPSVHSVFLDGETLWIATEGGLLAAPLPKQKSLSPHASLVN